MAYLIKDKLRHTIMWLKDTGILEKLKYDAVNPPYLIPDPIVRVDEPLILKQLGIIMMFLAAGLFIGTIVFLVELFKRPKLNNTFKTVNGAAMTPPPTPPPTPMHRPPKEALVIIDIDQNISPEPSKQIINP